MTTPSTQHVFNVQLVVKGGDRSDAYSELAGKLNDWFLESREVPYPIGSLLFWSTKEGK